MHLIIWNELEKLRHCLDMQQLTTGRNGIFFQRWTISGGGFSLRTIGARGTRFHFIQWHFPQDHFLGVCSDESTLLLYTNADRFSGEDGSIEILHSGSPLPAYYFRSSQGSMIIIDNCSINNVLAEAAPLPDCVETRILLQEIMKECGSRHSDEWLKERWEHLSKTLLRESHEGNRLNHVPFKYRSQLIELAQKLYHFPETNDSIQALARSAGMSATYLKQFFAAFYGRSILQFRQHYRMQSSCRLLLKKTLSLNDVAIASGFQEDSNFVRAFQKHFGVSPIKGLR